ncbi:TPA: hypothetical protein ACKJYV_001047, partial [Neisseria gonorrhoeae]
TSLFNQLPYSRIHGIFINLFVPNQCFYKILNFNWYLEIFEIGQAAIKRSNTTADKSLCVGNSGKTMKITLKILMGLA